MPLTEMRQHHTKQLQIYSDEKHVDDGDVTSPKKHIETTYIEAGLGKVDNMITIDYRI